ncbi:MAG TPA: alpha/beta hydrolase-fold protein [Microbacteriaceae bacterium]|nr:alpha/beta hydrolase-fold protein [Microbacteriaceae bacterium]
MASQNNPIILPERFIDVCSYAGELIGPLAPSIAAGITVVVLAGALWRAHVLKRSGRSRAALRLASGISVAISLVLTLALAVNAWVGYVPSFEALGRWLDGRAEPAAVQGTMTTGDRTPTTLDSSAVFQVTVPAAARAVPDANAWVYLPPGYDQNPKLRYRAIVALHGDPGKGADWLVGGAIQRTLDTLIESGALPPVVLIAPDLSSGLGADYREPVNLPDGPAISDFVAQDVVAWLDSNLRTSSRAADRIIAGFSSGGFGSLVIGLHNPSVFGGIVSITPYTEPYTEAYKLGAGRSEWDPSRHIATVRTIPPVFLGMAGLETAKNGNLLAAALDQRDATYTKRVFENQPHTWQAARIMMPYGLVWMANELNWAEPLTNSMAGFPRECKPSPN